MQKRFAMALLFAAFAVAVPDAQEAAQPASDKQKAPAAAADPRSSQPMNIKVELTINDQTGPGEPSNKMVTLILADGANGSIRSGGSLPSGKEGLVQINVDARPQILASGAIRLALGLEYNPRGVGSDAPPQWFSLNEQLTVVLQPGKPLVVSQAADPASDRKITVQITASLLKP